MLFGRHGLHGGEMDFVAQRVLVEPDVGGEHAGFVNAVGVGMEIVQAVHLGLKAVFAGGLQHLDAGGGFLVGVGIDDEDVVLGVLLPLFERGFEAGAPFFLRGGKGFAAPLVFALFVGEFLVVFYVDDLGVGVGALESGDEFGGVGGFARALVSAQENEFLHGGGSLGVGVGGQRRVTRFNFVEAYGFQAAFMRFGHGGGL